MSCEEARQNMKEAMVAWRAVEEEVLQVMSAPLDSSVPRVFSEEQGERLGRLRGELEGAMSRYGAAAKTFFEALLRHRS